MYILSLGEEQQDIAMACPLQILKNTSWWSDVEKEIGEGDLDNVEEKDELGNILYAVFVNEKGRKDCVRLDIYQSMRCVLRTNKRYNPKNRSEYVPYLQEVRVVEFNMRKDSKCAWVYFGDVQKDDSKYDNENDSSSDTDTHNE